MKRTKTRFFIERHNVTIVRSASQSETHPLISTYAKEVPTLITFQGATRMAKRLSILLTVPLGLMSWIASVILVDLLVLQIYPVPDPLRHAPLVEIMASRPNAAVALNILGGNLALAFVTFTTARLTRHHHFRAGLIVLFTVLLLVSTNALLTHNFRWLHAIALPLSSLIGYVSARSGARVI